MLGGLKIFTIYKRNLQCYYLNFARVGGFHYAEDMRRTRRSLAVA